MFMPSVELQALLCERYDVAPPKAVAAATVQEKYLKVYEPPAPGTIPIRASGRSDAKAIENTFRW